MALYFSVGSSFGGNSFGCKFLGIFSILCLTALGCAQKNDRGLFLESSAPASSSLKTVSTEERYLIRKRLDAQQAVQPYEQIEFGRSNGRVVVSEEAASGVSGCPESMTPWLEATEHPTQKLAKLLLKAHQSSVEYFEANPGDFAAFKKIQTTLTPDKCFEDGADIYCGPGLLSASLFLMNQDRALHDWLSAMANTLVLTGSDDPYSSSIKDFVRYFVFGTFQSLTSASKLLTAANCETAQALLEAKGLKPEEWEINLCHLVTSHHFKKPPSHKEYHQRRNSKA